VFTITEKAAERAQYFMAQEGKEGWGMRIYKAGQSCCGAAYGVDLSENPSEGDAIYEKDGLKVFVDTECVDLLADKQLDYYEKDDEVGFVLSGGDEPSCDDCSGCG